ncbi:MAG TPA: hypothetical protein VK561_05050 [Bradyrhizobium sp.]|jgi:hypothetical protein|nr:hypothetical protein [Bradyrhizobium sp.]
MHDELDEIIPAGRSRVMGAVKILGAVTILSEHALEARKIRRLTAHLFDVGRPRRGRFGLWQALRPAA